MDEKKLDSMGIEKQDYFSFVNLLDNVAEMPGRTGGAQYATGDLHRESLTIPTRAECQFHTLPPTLTTLTGLRGLLLYRNALQLQARDEATCFDEAADAADASEASQSSDVVMEPFGNPRADQLLLFRLLSLFYWPDRFSKRPCNLLPSQAVETEAGVINLIYNSINSKLW